MKIGILGNALLDRKTGTARYAYNLIKHLSILDSDNDYFVFTERRDFEHGSLNLKPNFKLIGSKIYLDNRLFRLSWEQAYLPFQTLLKRLELFHSPEPLMPLILPCRSVVTIYDLIYQHFPETFERAHLLRLKSSLPFIARRAAMIITGSDYSKREIVEYIGIPAEKVKVVYPATEERFRRTNNQTSFQEVKKKCGIKGRFILNVGVLDRRKNLPKLIKVFSELKRARRIEHQLVICGAKREPLYQELVNLAQRLGVSRDVVFTDFVPDEDLPAFYNAADVFVYPSLYEGFGLPVLEAMACGTPVITSNVSSLPEIAGGATALIDPSDNKSLAGAIVDVIGNESLKMNLTEKGLKRAKQFSWQKTAEQHLAIYKDVLKGESKQCE